ncbi:hypothetical protein NFIA_114970 [Paecilomyces variotii No. 5]|uniref:Uncharacterized protein n=1 Tax=Byssochlamys spectabilis (strain No. 5 / NBRC 109023) TaxID=1356009 RepID=V5FPY8_BYSSN|nr:hypothetical protein NFIA_114970 [Paecilomyces variotii No. 5]
MNQSTLLGVQPPPGPENEKGIKKEEDSTVPGPVSASGDQRVLSPQVESLARALVVPYHQNQNQTQNPVQNQRAPDLTDSSKTYVPLAVAMASNSNVGQNQNQHQPQYAYGQGEGQNQGMAVRSAVSGYSPGPFSSMMNPGAMYPFNSTSRQGWGTGSVMSSGYGNGFGQPYAPATNMWARPMGRAFTLTPTPEPQGFIGPSGFPASGQGAFGFAHQRRPSLATSPPASSPSYVYPSGASASAGYAMQIQGPLIKDENEENKVPLEAQVQRLHLSPSFVTPEPSASTHAPARAQSHPVVSPRFPGTFPSLGALDMKTLSPRLVLFYFGVLTTQASLMPRFDFAKEDRGTWSVTLTLYGHTLVKEECGSQAAAKVTVCRDAIETLRQQYPGWTVPDEPHEAETESLWSWTNLFNKYCEHNKLFPPKYTKYVHVKGYRYEVEVDGASYFGVPKSHRTEREAMSAAAHMGMYSTLVSCLQDDVSLLGGELSPAVNPGLGTARSLVAAHKAAAKDKGAQALKNIIMPKGNAAAPKVGKKKKKARKINSNLLPVVNRRISEIITPSNSTRASRWNVTPSEIKTQTNQICDLLNIQYPEIEITQTDGRLVDNSEGEYHATAFFPNDPFLARVGPIGAVRQVMNNKDEAREVCSRKVIDYLIKMVEEDTAMDKEVAKEKEKVERWKENAVSQYVHQGFVSAEQGEVLMKDA